MLERIKSRLSVELTEENYHYMLRQFNQIVAHEAMVECDGNVTKSAEMMGLTRATFTTYLRCKSSEWNNEFMETERLTRSRPSRQNNGKYRWEK